MKTGKPRSITQNDFMVFTFLVRFKREYGGASPTYREIVKNTPYRSTSTVHHSLVKLEDAGFITLSGPSSHIGICSEAWIRMRTDLPKIGKVVASKYTEINNMINGIREAIEYISLMRDMSTEENPLEEETLDKLFNIEEYLYKEWEKHIP